MRGFLADFFLFCAAESVVLAATSVAIRKADMKIRRDMQKFPLMVVKKNGNVTEGAEELRLLPELKLRRKSEFLLP